MMRVVLSGFVVLLFLGVPAGAQAVQQRAADLEQIAVRLNDPDPMPRVAAMEEILRSNEGRKIALATAIVAEIR